MASSDRHNTLRGQIESYTPIVVSNDGRGFVRHDGQGGKPAFRPEHFFRHVPPAVMDAETVELLQVQQLHAAIDLTRTATGSAALLRSLLQPATDSFYIRGRQEALREIAARDNLREALEGCIHEFALGENALYKFFNKGLYALFPYHDARRARRAAAGITRIVRDLPAVESPYLAAVASCLRAYEGTAIDQMMRGAIYKTLGGVQSAGEVGALTPRLKYTGSRFSPWLLAGPLLAAAPHLQGRLGFGPALPPLTTHAGILLTGISLLYCLFFKPARDTFNCLEPFRQKCVADPVFNRAIDAFGIIDELLSCDSFARKVPHASSLPEIVSSRHHAFDATGLKNPVLAVDSPDFVANDVHLEGVRLTFISGPNSGGKTTLCKSIAQNQLLAQAGTYVLAEKAVVGIADRIRYQAPRFDGLQDDEGRFGTELGRTRDIFFATTPNSLVILDELAEGTTVEERLQESCGILDDFYTIGNNTLLVTHNHSLVDRFMEDKKGQCLMTEFKGDTPTYRVVDGISRESHAARIAEKIRFSSRDRRRWLKDKGYL
jgi:DNA mismatch repair protein MutS